ncbi:hypothetical protein VTL71DRAFT_215 [Oculimacula yallundae]|uniref:Uncharacterized protein n=1 Tax=Oculimacula yallundae TaxID=86028 RepID=A0ABR4D0C2_9HELO
MTSPSQIIIGPCPRCILQTSNPGECVFCASKRGIRENSIRLAEVIDQTLTGCSTTCGEGCIISDTGYGVVTIGRIGITTSNGVSSLKPPPKAKFYPSTESKSRLQRRRLGGPPHLLLNRSGVLIINNIRITSANEGRDLTINGVRVTTSEGGQVLSVNGIRITTSDAGELLSINNTRLPTSGTPTAEIFEAAEPERGVGRSWSLWELVLELWKWNSRFHLVVLLLRFLISAFFPSTR